MKWFGLSLLLLLVALLGYCSLPLTSVATLTVSVSDQSGKKITSGATATFLDAHGAAITTVASGDAGSWDNSLHWWSHSHHATSRLRPSDARRAAAVRIAATGCEAVTLPVSLQRHYEPLSLMPHGGGPAYLLYTFQGTAVLLCS